MGGALSEETDSSSGSAQPGAEWASGAGSIWTAPNWGDPPAVTCVAAGSHRGGPGPPSTSPSAGHGAGSLLTPNPALSPAAGLTQAAVSRPAVSTGPESSSPPLQGTATDLPTLAPPPQRHLPRRLARSRRSGRRPAWQGVTGAGHKAPHSLCPPAVPAPGTDGTGTGPCPLPLGGLRESGQNSTVWAPACTSGRSARTPHTSGTAGCPRQIQDLAKLKTEPSEGKGGSRGTGPLSPV